MNILMRKLALTLLNRKPPVSKFRICNALLPYLKTYGLTLTDKEILFPQNNRAFSVRMRIVSAYTGYEKSISYDVIVGIEETSGGLNLLLRTGHLFRFEAESPVLRMGNLYRYGEPSAWTLRWWRIAGWVGDRWWKIRKLPVPTKTGSVHH